MKEGIHYMTSHNVNGISFDNMTCLMIMKIVQISSHMKGQTQAQKRSCLLFMSFHMYSGDTKYILHHRNDTYVFIFKFELLGRKQVRTREGSQTYLKTINKEDY